MIRLLLIPCFAIFFLSCEGFSDEEPLVYQMSEADSTRCMEEILVGILEEGQNWQIEREMELSQIHYPICFPPEHFDIYLNSAGQLMVDGEIDSLDLISEVYDFFMFNRNLAKSEVGKYASNPNYEGFDKPFYNLFSSEEINRRIQEESSELERIRKIEGVDSALIDYHKSKVQEWEKRKFALDIIGSDALPEGRIGVFVRFEYQKEIAMCATVLNEISFAFYQMRNYECLKYFDETYLSLYERAQRLERRLEEEKLEVLKLIQPARIVCRDRSKPYSAFVEAPPEPVN